MHELNRRVYLDDSIWCDIADDEEVNALYIEFRPVTRATFTGFRRKLALLLVEYEMLTRDSSVGKIVRGEAQTDLPLD